jgi:hypothetical protein
LSHVRDGASGLFLCGVGVREVLRNGNHLTIFEEFADGGCAGHLYHWLGDRWEPPLPLGVEAPERSQSRGRGMIERFGAAHATTRRRHDNEYRGQSHARGDPSGRPGRSAPMLAPIGRSSSSSAGYVDYKVSVGGTAREAILDEIKRAHRAAGQPVEAAGWLFGWHRP